MEAVVFDVGGVLVTSPVDIIREYEKELSLPRYTIGRSFVINSPDNAFCRLERGEMCLSEFCEEFQTECRINASSKGIHIPSEFSVRELFDRMYHEIKPIPEMIKTLQAVKKLGYKTGIITNNWIDDVHPRPFTSNPQLPVLNDVDVVIQSSQVGMRKPDPEIYRLACDQLGGVHPRKVVFLDDLTYNIKGAREVGMETVLVSQPVTGAIKKLEDILNQHRTNKITLINCNSKL